MKGEKEEREGGRRGGREGGLLVFGTSIYIFEKRKGGLLLS